MKNIIIAIIVAVGLFLSGSFYTATLVKNNPLPLGGGVSISNFSSFASSSVMSVTSSNSQVMATNTARVYARLTNPGPGNVFCNLRNGAPATLNNGLTILASTTVAFEVDQNPYVGSVNCISTATTNVSLLEK